MMILNKAVRSTINHQIDRFDQTQGLFDIDMAVESCGTKQPYKHVYLKNPCFVIVHNWIIHAFFVHLNDMTCLGLFFVIVV